MNIRAIIFDIDGTLSPEVSWTALTRDLGTSPEEHLRIYEAYKQGTISYKESKEQLLALWQATGNANRSFFIELFKRWPLMANAKKVVATLQEHYAVCLITGSMDAYAEVLAQRLNVTEWYANTPLYWNAAGELIDYDYDINQAAGKLAQFKQFCAAHDIPEQACAVVGDSDNDLAIFQASGKGILLQTENNQALRPHAWKTITKLEDLIALV